MQSLIIATRGSKLALWQAEYIRSSLLRLQPGLHKIDLLIVKTKGDIIQDVPLAKVGGKGLFVKEIEEALLDGRAHLAVHSMKDVPMELPQGLVLGAIPERETPADVLLSAKYPNLQSLPQGAVLGTSSLRRQAQILALRPDLDVRSLRGNIDTRLRKLMDGDYDATLMAEAGLQRLGLSAPYRNPMCIPEFLPAVGQGALGVEVREDRKDLLEMLAPLEHRATRICVEAERGFLAGLDGGCQVPIAAYAHMLDDASFSLTGLVMDCRGERAVRRSITGPAHAARQSGLQLADTVKNAGAAAILAELYPATHGE